MGSKLYDKILGAMVGGAIGDAYGAVVEFADAERLKRISGGDWIDEFLPFPEDSTHPLGVWSRRAMRGVSTDDLRNNQIFVEAVLRNDGHINPQFLAMEYIDRYRDPERYYPPQHADLARQHFGYTYPWACAFLGMRDNALGEMSRYDANRPGRFPSLSGLISLALVGLLFENDPEAAYLKAIDVDFLDVGYAKDCVAILAAMVSAALADGMDGKRMIDVGLSTNPLEMPSPFLFDDRYAIHYLKSFVSCADASSDERDLVQRLAVEAGNRHPYEALDVLGPAMAAVAYTNGDPVKSIEIVANHRWINDDGTLRKLRDVDCTGGVAGAMVGALHGVDGFPSDWVEDTLVANREAYNIDIEKNAKAFMKCVYGE